jgi:hypothetical protein
MVSGVQMLSWHHGMGTVFFTLLIMGNLVLVLLEEA